MKRRLIQWVLIIDLLLIAAVIWYFRALSLPDQGIAMTRARITPAAALKALEMAGGESTTLCRHGSLQVEIYRPASVDRQQPHRFDELYVVISGIGAFLRGAERMAFAPGDALFVPAGVEHRFIDFSEDFATWAFCYGPEGGEAA